MCTVTQLLTVALSSQCKDSTLSHQLLCNANQTRVEAILSANYKLYSQGVYWSDYQSILTVVQYAVFDCLQKVL